MPKSYTKNGGLAQGSNIASPPLVYQKNFNTSDDAKAQKIDRLFFRMKAVYTFPKTQRIYQVFNPIGIF
jgi:hypothetical protein